jgi:maltose operon protein
MSADRLEGVMRLTPALGQQKSMFWSSPPRKICSRPPRCSIRLKPMPKVPVTRFRIFRIRLPVTSPTALKLKVKTNSGSSVLVGPLFGSSGTGPVTVGNTAAPAYTAPAATAAAPVATAAPAPAKKAEPVLNDTESTSTTPLSRR